jgi:hypothetical protein
MEQWLRNGVGTRPKDALEFVEKWRVTLSEQASDILHDEIPWLELDDQSCELQQQLVSWIANTSFAANGKALAWGTAENDVDIAFPELGNSTDFLAS